MQEEYDLFMANITWELTKFFKDCKSVGCKWMFCLKKNALGQIVRYNAWLVLEEYSQMAIVDLTKPLLLWPCLSVVDALLY